MWTQLEVGAACILCSLRKHIENGCGWQGRNQGGARGARPSLWASGGPRIESGLLWAEGSRGQKARPRRTKFTVIPKITSEQSGPSDQPDTSLPSYFLGPLVNNR